jgi:hypothetical protein
MTTLFKVTASGVHHTNLHHNRILLDWLGRWIAKQLDVGKFLALEHQQVAAELHQGWHCSDKGDPCLITWIMTKTPRSEGWNKRLHVCKS